MSRISTPLADRLGLRYPLVAAPMFLLSNVEMVVAAARAGILGAVPNHNFRDAAAFAEAVRAIRARTDAAFAVNITIKLTDLERLEHDLRVCRDYRVPVVITTWGNPFDIVERCHAADMLVFHDVVGLAHALKAEAAGVDAIVGVAAGAGGHASATSPFALIPYLRAHVSVPVVAAGCITGGRQLAAALALGAELAYVGTRFIASTECPAPEAYKRLVVGGRPEDIVYTDRVSGVPSNWLRCTVPGTGEDEAARAARWKEVWSAGQGVCLARDVRPMGEIVREIVEEYAAAVAAMPAPRSAEPSTEELRP